jgi:hypothetical protein
MMLPIPTKAIFKNDKKILFETASNILRKFARPGNRTQDVIDVSFYFMSIYTGNPY